MVLQIGSPPNTNEKNYMLPSCLTPLLVAVACLWSTSSLAAQCPGVGCTGTVGTYQGSTPGSITNPDQLNAPPVIIGTTWTATVTAQPARVGASGALILVSDMGAPGVTILIDLAPILVGNGSAPVSQLLISGSLLTTLNAPLSGAGSSGSASINIPMNLSLVCCPWYAQAIVFGDITGPNPASLDPMFSSAVAGIIGI